MCSIFGAPPPPPRTTPSHHPQLPLPSPSQLCCSLLLSASLFSSLSLSLQPSNTTAHLLFSYRLAISPTIVCLFVLTPLTHPSQLALTSDDQRPQIESNSEFFLLPSHSDVSYSVSSLFQQVSLRLSSCCGMSNQSDHMIKVSSA